MPRNRLLKREFFRDDKVAALSFGARLLFQSLWIEADDSGNGRADERLLRSEGFPYDDGISVANVQEMLAEVVKTGMVRTYEVGGTKFYHVVNFLRHQTIDRPSKFRHPAPPWLGDRSDERSTEHSDEQSSNTRRVLDCERERRKKKENEKEKEERESGASSAATTETSTDSVKDRLNSLYKKKLGFDIVWPKHSGAVNELVGRIDCQRIVAVYEFYLSKTDSNTDDRWIVDESYPVGYFLKHFDKLLAECDRSVKDSVSMLTADDIARDEENDIKNWKPRPRPKTAARGVN